MNLNRPKYISKIPEVQPNFQELLVQLRLNADIIKKEISTHVDEEIMRFEQKIRSIQEPGYFS